jgi:acid phosphatase (class A)
MNVHASGWFRPARYCWTTLVSLVLVPPVAPAGEADSKSPFFAPPRGHYAKLGQSDVRPTAPGLPIDAERWKTDPKFIERIEHIVPEFVQVPLETFKLPDCPANSSKQTRAELDYLLRLQAGRTKTEGERALYFAPWGYSPSMRPDNPEFPEQQRNLFYVGRSIGSWFNPHDLPVTAQLLGRIWRDAGSYMWRLKFKYARIRPYNIDSNIKPLERPDWAAFPSGHSFYSHLLAYLYSDLAPEFSDIFLNDARGIAHSREIIGVHFPSDSEAGRVAAGQFADLLLASEKFKPEWDKVKAEWNRVRAASPD